MRMRGSEGSNAVACASVQMDPLLSLTISTYNCVQAGMQSCMSNKRKGGRITLNNYSHWEKTHKNLNQSIKTLPHVLNLTRENTWHVHRPCPSVLRAAQCLIIQPVLAKLRSRHHQQQLSSHPPPCSNGVLLVLSPGQPTRKASGRVSCILRGEPHLAFCGGVPAENILLYFFT